MLVSKFSIPLILAASIAGGALTAGVAVGSSKDKLEQHAADIAELKAHDRDTNGTVHEMAGDLKELRNAVERIEQAVRR